jgi:hypothetical protein
MNLGADAIDLAPNVGNSVKDLPNSVYSVYVSIGADADILSLVRRGKINLIPF